MEFVNVDVEANELDVGGFFYADMEVRSDPSGDASQAQENGVQEIGGFQEHEELEESFEDYKLLAEIRPADAYVLQKMRNAVIVPTYEQKGSKTRKIGAPLVVEGSTAKDYSDNLNQIGKSCFPEGAKNRALEVIY